MVLGWISIQPFKWRNHISLLFLFFIFIIEPSERFDARRRRRHHQTTALVKYYMCISSVNWSVKNFQARVNTLLHLFRSLLSDSIIMYNASKLPANGHFITRMRTNFTQFFLLSLLLFRFRFNSHTKIDFDWTMEKKPNAFLYQNSKICDCEVIESVP